MLRTITLAYNWANILTQSLFYNKVLNISCNLLNTVLKVKNSGCMGTDICQCTGCLPWWQRCWLGAEARCCCPTSREYHTIYHKTGKNQNSKFEVRFLLNAYHFHTTVKSKNPKSNHRKSGTICNDNIKKTKKTYPIKFMWGLNKRINKENLE